MAVAVRALPTLLLGPWGGVLADRWDRRRLAMGSQLGLAAAAFGFAWLVAVGMVDNPWYVYGYTLVSGVGFAIVQPVRQALIANTVRSEHMGNAFAVNALAVTSMRLVGAGAGGVLIETVDFQWNFFVEAVLYSLMALLLIPMKTPYREPGTAREYSPWANLRHGLAYVLGHRIMLRLMLLNFFRTGIFAPLLLLLPVYASEALDAGAGVGAAMIVSMGIGGVTATALMSSRGFLFGKGLMILVTLLSGSAVVAVLGFSPWVWLSVPVMVVMGLSQSHFHRRQPDPGAKPGAGHAAGAGDERLALRTRVDSHVLRRHRAAGNLRRHFLGHGRVRLGGHRPEPFLPGPFHRHSPVGVGVSPEVRFCLGGRGLGG